MNKEELEILIRQLLDGGLSTESQAKLKHFISIEANRESFVEIVESLTSVNKEEVPFREDIWLPVISKVVNGTIAPVKKVNFLQKPIVRYAAAVLLIISMATFFLVRKNNGSDIVQQPAQQNIPPGHDGAFLVLADGTTVLLDSAGSGEVATQNGARIIQQHGKLVYHSSGQATAAVQYNTMTTPKGRQFQLKLPDGTGVWLNAASSIRYPVVFTGSERKVEITGEVYFEVAKNKQLPFRVSAAGRSEIEVLGTSFNVNAYDNESALNTTLIEGAVSVTAGQEKVVLTPGQQAQLTQALKVTAGINPIQVIAWKDGLFNFDNISLQQAMREIERWYDIVVQYEGTIPDIHFGGKLPKNISLEELLNALAATEVHFRMQGKTLIVSK